MTPSQKRDVVIIGAGAAGLMCAIEAGRRGRRVLVIEHNDRPGKKILISGGGRCNFTNLHAKSENYLSENSDFAKSALSRYTSSDFISLVEKHGIPYHEKKLGQLFCNQSSRQILDLLQQECAEAQVEIKTGVHVHSVEKNLSFRIKTDIGDFEPDSLVIATGGLSFQKLGASAFGYEVAKKFNLKITKLLQPGLVPIELQIDDAFRNLSGISADCVATCSGVSFRENLLITHRGLSGPAILQTSSYYQPGKDFLINLLPNMTAENLFSGENLRLKPTALLGLHLSQRFADYICRELPDKPLANLPKKNIQQLADRLQKWKITPSGTEGYSKAEVTVGGVSTSELSSKTMEARSVSGLYFIGEVVDVTGWLGGYNFQWAWSSGYAAGQVA